MTLTRDKIKKHVSPTLVVCVAAGAFAAGALFVQPQDSSAAAPVAASGVAAAGPAGRYRDAGGAAGDPAGAATIEISNFQISAVAVTPGAQVTVVNRDDTEHTVTANDGSFSTDAVPGGGTATFVAPNDPGTYAVFCKIHPSMRSTVTVG